MASISGLLGLSAQQVSQEQMNAYSDYLNNAYSPYLSPIVNHFGFDMSNPHLGTIREFRRKFKQYSTEEFRNLSKTSVVKDILSGMTKLNKEDIQNRIKEHLNQ